MPGRLGSASVKLATAPTKGTPSTGTKLIPWLDSAESTTFAVTPIAGEVVKPGLLIVTFTLYEPPP